MRSTPLCRPRLPSVSPTSFDDAHAAPLLCAGIVGYRALRLSNIQPQQKLGLYGFGASAHIVLQIAVHWGCEVLVATRSAEHQRLAKELGASWVGRAEEVPRATLHSAAMFAPAGTLVPEALRALRKGGTLALGGIYMTPIPEIEVRVALSRTRDAVGSQRHARGCPIS